MEQSNQAEKGSKKKSYVTTILLLVLIVIPIAYLMINGGSDSKKQQLSVEKKRLSEAEQKEFDKYFIDGYNAINNKELDRAIALTKTAIAIDPASAPAYNNLGAAYNELKMWDSAIVACQKALEIDPNFTLAKNNLNWALQEKSKQ